MASALSVRILITVCVAVFALAPRTALAADSAASVARSFRAGAATSNITPALGAGIVGNFTIPVATHVHDELHARCLVLDDGSTRLVFVVVDNLSVAREVFDSAKRLIRDATQIPVENMMMSATHTHSGPSARGADPFVYGAPLDGYQEFLAQRIADGVRRAVNQLEPARIAWGRGELPQHLFNRRWLLKDAKTAVNPFGGQDRAVMNPGRRPDLQQPAGPTNPEVYFISVQSTNGRPIALLANYWLHYVGGVSAGHISADYFAVFCDRIQQLLGADRQQPAFVGLLANGPCGDVNNINVAGPPEPRRAPYEKMRMVAEDLAQEVARVHRTVAFREWVELKAAQSELSLAMRRPTPEVVERAGEILRRPATVTPAHQREADYARRTLSARNWPETLPIVLQTFRIGDLGVAAIPFEVLTEIGLAIKARSPFKDTFTIELANGGEGYLPTPEQHALGGYETWLGTNRVEVEASRKIEAEILQLFGRIR